MVALPTITLDKVTSCGTNIKPFSQVSFTTCEASQFRLTVCDLGVRTRVSSHLTNHKAPSELGHMAATPQHYGDTRYRHECQYLHVYANTTKVQMLQDSALSFRNVLILARSMITRNAEQI